jgi:enoyl-CoA hydratase
MAQYSGPIAVAHDVIARRVGRVGHLTLSRPEAINALTVEMAVELLDLLRAWERDDTLACMLLTGAGDRGFCAGGDIVRLHEWIRLDRADLARAFWRTEYELDLAIATFPKPVVTVMHGIVMGGGVGLACHASHRLITEPVAVAMPEVGIGLAPDVGGAYLLSRAPGEAGTHLALTGRRIDAIDAVFCGLADWVIAPEAVAALPQALSEGEVDEVIPTLPSTRVQDLPEGMLEGSRAWIDDAYRADSVEQILARLRGRPEPEAHRAATEIEAKSPTALKVTLRALRKARQLLTLGDCLDQDYRVTSRFFASHDLAEGIRAAVVDKDRHPAWGPSNLAEVTRGIVDLHFEPVDDELGFGSGVYDKSGPGA